MSYEGYEQFLCPEGHLWTLDAFWYDYPSIETQNTQNGWPLCPDCKKLPVWKNSIDQTNGCDRLDEKGHHSDCQCGYVELELAEPVKDCVCQNCGSHHSKEPPRYKIPEKGRVNPADPQSEANVLDRRDQT